MENSVRKLFERYESFFKQSLGGDIDMDEVASLYASDFIAASPAGVMAGKNDDQLKQVMAQGYAHYRAIGTKEMRIRNVRLSPIDEHHCVAHVAWTATYARQDRAGRSDRFRCPLLRSEVGRGAEGFWLGIGRRAGAVKEARHHLKSLPTLSCRRGLGGLSDRVLFVLALDHLRWPHDVAIGSNDIETRYAGTGARPAGERAMAFGILSWSIERHPRKAGRSFPTEKSTRQFTYELKSKSSHRSFQEVKPASTTVAYR